MTFQWDEVVRTKALRRENTEYIFEGKQTASIPRVWGVSKGGNIS